MEGEPTYDVLITAPHWCVKDQSLDISCDLGTKTYSEEIYKEILNIKGKKQVKLFLADVGTECQGAMQWFTLSIDI